MANLNQSHFRFGKEELLEATHGWWQNEDTNHTQLISADWAFLLRFTEQEPGVAAISNVDAQFQYNKNGAGWVNITTTSAIVKAVASVAFTNGQACTKRLSGTGTFESSGAGCTEDGSSGGTANDIVLNGNSETEAGLQVVFADVANGDTIQFRLTSPDATMVYIVTPTLTIQMVVYEYGVATLSGLGNLTGAGARIRSGLATLVGAGTVAAIGKRIRTGIVVLSGVGSLAGIPQRIRYGIGTLTGIGALSTAWTRIRTGAAILNGVGSVAAIGTVISGAIYEYGSALLSGAGNLVAAGVRTLKGASVLAGSGVLSALGGRLLRATSTLAGTGYLSALGGKLAVAAVLLQGLGTLSGTATRVRTSLATLSGWGVLVAKGSYYRILRIFSDVSVSEDLNLSVKAKKGLGLTATISSPLVLATSLKGG